MKCGAAFPSPTIFCISMLLCGCAVSDSDATLRERLIAREAEGLNEISSTPTGAVPDSSVREVENPQSESHGN
jgi:hypothetical protein